METEVAVAEIAEEMRDSVAVVFIGAPGVFFFIVFMPALQNTKGRMVGYKDHKTYGDSTIYEVTRKV